MDDPLPASLVSEWGTFVKHDGTMDGLFASPVLFPLQRRREMEQMHRLAAKISPHTVMEIGADKGGSVYAWCLNVPTIRRFIACEIRGTPYASDMEEAFPSIDFCWLPMSSYAANTVKQVCTWLGNDRIDVLFIDGDKSYFDRDFNCYLPMVRNGGIVMMHDVNHQPMASAFAKCRQGHKWTEIIDVAEWEELRDAGRAARTAHEHWLLYWKDTTCTVGVIYRE